MELCEERAALSDRYVAAIDQGTSSSRCLVFDQQGRIVSRCQKEHEQIFPRPGWVEHDPREILRNVIEVVHGALDTGGLDVRDLVAVGIANQRETTVWWDPHTGEPVQNAIVWQDTRTDALCRRLGAEHGQDRFRDRCGLPLATYFSGPKVSWLLDSAPGLRRRAEQGDLLFGTMDSWLVWNLTGRHVTDVTNASRTMLMNLETLDWDDTLLDAIGVPRAMLPAIQPSPQIYGAAGDSLGGVPIAAALGDQQAALFGQTCFSAGEAKCTYGTGSFLLLNTGNRRVVAGQRAGAGRTWVAHHGGVEDRGQARDLRARGLDRGHRGAGPVVPRQGGAHRQRARGRNPRTDRRRQRRHLLRPGILGPVRAALAWRCTRRDCRPHWLCHQGSPGSRCARSHCMADSRSRLCDERRFGHRNELSQSRRGDDRHHPLDAVHRRRARGAGGTPERGGDRLARSGLCGRSCGRILAERREPEGELAQGRRVDSQDGRGRARTRLPQVEESSPAHAGLGG